MPVLSSALRHLINLSLSDLQTPLSDKRYKLDRAPIVSEEKYHSKVLIGNWFERRVPSIPFSDKLITIYEQDYQPHHTDAYKKDHVALWDNKIGNEGLDKSALMDHGKAYRDNMTTMNDLIYKILPTNLHKPTFRTYNIRKNKWLPEQDLTKSFGNLTQFGIKNALKVLWESDSSEAMQFCRWRTTYQDEYKAREGSLIKNQFHRRRPNMNVPCLNHLYRGTDGYPKGCPIAFKISNKKIVR
ncbi:hypothetical protein KPH14_007227 [Odynerus spinipes]|uniref:Uncharacterized protein n=1 Tax=Odynerus spinipes TaxID=1348599 RepID=A0AAD9VIF8_9HYME|nr:hypothetical protein KPH14_007227 [Odynerus spinipes]